MVSMEREGVRVAGFLAGVDAGALVTHWSRDSRRASSAAWSWAESVERRSSQAEAEAGMELMEVPPEIEPMLRVVRGACAFGAAGSLLLSELIMDAYVLPSSLKIAQDTWGGFMGAMLHYPQSLRPRALAARLRRRTQEVEVELEEDSEIEP